MEQTKVCTYCKIEKPFSEFGKDAARMLGITYECRLCRRAMHKQYFVRMMADPERKKAHLLTFAKRRNNPAEKEKVKNRSRRYRQNSQKYREYVAEYIRTNPEKRKAKDAVNNAIKSGKLVKPSNCQLCGSTKHIHGHHEDYSEPLEVLWVCAKCHKVVHGLVKYL